MGRKNGLIIVAQNFFIIFYVKNLRKFNANKFKPTNAERTIEDQRLIIVALNFFIIFYVNTNISEPRLRSFLLFFMSKNLRKSDINIFSVNNVEPTIENQRRTVIAQDFFIILYVKNLRKSNTNMEPTIEDQMIDGP